MAATHGGRITYDGADEYENPRTSVVISSPPQDRYYNITRNPQSFTIIVFLSLSPQHFTFREEHDGEDT